MCRTVQHVQALDNRCRQSRRTLRRHGGRVERKTLLQRDSSIVEPPEHQERDVQGRAPFDRAHSGAPHPTWRARCPHVAHRQQRKREDDRDDQHVEQCERHRVGGERQNGLQRGIEASRVPRLHDARRYRGQRRDAGDNQNRRRKCRVTKHLRAHVEMRETVEPCVT